jgi:hypothetical protein
MEILRFYYIINNFNRYHIKLKYIRVIETRKLKNNKVIMKFSCFPKISYYMYKSENVKSENLVKTFDDILIDSNIL